MQVSDGSGREVQFAVPRVGRVRVGLVLAVVVALLAIGVALHRKNVNLGVNGSIRLDDFLFTVTSAGKTSGAATAGPGLVDYEVTLVVTNRAKRVDFTFRDENTVLIGPDGREYHCAPSPPSLRPIPAGSAETRRLIYRVPADLTRPRFRLMPGGRVGEVLETVLMGRQQFVLP